MPRTLCKHETPPPKIKRQRTKFEVEEPIKLKGGFIGNPPSDCPYRRLNEGDGQYYADLTCCGFSCRKHRNCKTWKQFQNYRKKNPPIKR